jgi:peroxiredoxin
MRSDIVPGAIFPDYELSDHTGKHRKLSELQGGDPMIVVLSRGGYCPKDRRQAEGLVRLHREMEVGYCRRVTISTDNITETNENRSGVGAHWPFLVKRHSIRLTKSVRHRLRISYLEIARSRLLRSASCSSSSIT